MSAAGKLTSKLSGEFSRIDEYSMGQKRLERDTLL